jgi:hypothetical protein
MIKSNIKGNWEDASIRKIILQESMENIKDKTFIGQEVLMVDFPSSDNRHKVGLWFMQT